MSDKEKENLLAAVTDALLKEGDDIDAILSRHQVSRSEYEGVIKVLTRLHVVLVGVRPSRIFVQRLKQDLIGTPQRGFVAQLRHLPARVQIAAGVALVAGFMLLTRRRLVMDQQEASQPQPQEVIS
jgi:hypothetical protein